MKLENFRPKARRDVEFAAAYYAAEAGPQIVAKFLEALDRTVERIEEKPLIATRRWPQTGADELRGWPIRGFPYLVFYFVRTDRIDVVRVLHISRDLPATLRD